MHAVRWYDNRCVTLLSTFSSANPTSMVKRYDRKKKKVVEVECPNMVATYNRSMGGVDLFDSLISLYRIKIRSKKWYLRIVFHLLHLICVEAWLLYRRDCVKSGVTKEMPLLDFKSELAQCLTVAPIKRKVGRRPSTDVEVQLEAKRHRGPTAAVPPPAIRLDQKSHWPTYAKRARCKLPGCTGYTKVTCQKCMTALCFTSNKNCYQKFHE